jgi:hypothetical protein
MAEVNLLNPGALATQFETKTETSASGFSLTEFKSDAANNIQRNGYVKFKQGWVERHAGFFSQYEEYLARGGFFEVRIKKFAARQQWVKTERDLLKQQQRKQMMEEVALKAVEASNLAAGSDAA